jgi:hypothetical protein
VRRRVWREMKGGVEVLLKAEKERLDGLDGGTTEGASRLMMSSLSLSVSMS